MANPFVYGEPVPADDPRALADRDEELELLCRSMLGGRNVILIAPRRYGKTSLLRRAVHDVAARGGRTGWVSLTDCASARDVAESLLAGVLSGPASWGQRMSAAVRQRLEALGASVRLRSGTPIAGEVSVNLGPGAHGWRETVADVLRLLRDAGADGAPVSLVIDEFQVAHEVDPALPAVFKRITDDVRGVSLVLSGSSRHMMSQLTSGRGAPLARLGTTVALPKVPREVMIDFLVRRASEGGRLLAPDVAGQIHAAAAGVPNEIQQIAWFAYEVSGGRRIRPADVAAAEDLLLRQARFEFEAIYRHCSPAARRLLKVLAADGPIRSLASRAMVDRVDVANPSGVTKPARVLERDDLIELTPEGWRIANPLFARWLAGAARWS